MKKGFFIIVLLICISPLSAYRFLFDLTKHEDTGNADWVIDDDWPYPYPDNPIADTAWHGAISSWGYELYMMGHEVVTLPPWDSITYGNPEHELDLMYFDVFIIPEPQNPFSENEKQAILEFVANGGGLFLVADHNSSDRDQDGWDSPRVFNAVSPTLPDTALLYGFGVDTIFGIHFNVTGEPFNYITDAPDSNVNDLPSDSIIFGEVGRVYAISYHAGTVMTLYPSYNPSVTAHVWKTDMPHDTIYVMFATAEYGRGRVAAIGDSSPADDGTARPGNQHIYDGWREAGCDNRIIFLNASLWLAKGSTPVKERNGNSFRIDVESDYDIFSVTGRKVFTGKLNVFYHLNLKSGVYLLKSKENPNKTARIIILK